MDPRGAFKRLARIQEVMPSSQLASLPNVAPVAADHFAQNQQRPGVAEDLERRIDGASATQFVYMAA